MFAVSWLACSLLHCGWHSPDTLVGQYGAGYLRNNIYVPQLVIKLSLLLMFYGGRGIMVSGGPFIRCQSVC